MHRGLNLPEKEGGLRKLYRSNNNKIIAGVCGGIAERYSLNPWAVRVAAVLIGVITLPVAIIGICLLAWMFVPRSPEDWRP